MSVSELISAFQEDGCFSFTVQGGDDLAREILIQIENLRIHFQEVAPGGHVYPGFLKYPDALNPDRQEIGYTRFETENHEQVHNLRIAVKSSGLITPTEPDRSPLGVPGWDVNFHFSTFDRRGDDVRGGA